MSHEIDEKSGLPIGVPVEAAPAPRPQRLTMQGRFVSLVPLSAQAHARDLYEGTHGADKEKLWLYLFDGPYPDFESFRASLEKKEKSEDPLFFAVIDNATGRCVGHATYMRIDPTHRVIEVGNILYSTVLQRTPAATEAMYLMARHVFEDLGYRRYEWKCNDLNAPSRRAAERYGFTYEGTFRQAIIVKGRNRDTAWYSMLDHEWPARKAAFETWLSAENFDEAGRQKTSLAVLNGVQP